MTAVVEAPPFGRRFVHPGMPARPRPRILHARSQLCPYCAAWPTVPCADAFAARPYFLSYVHAGEPGFDELYELDLLLTALDALDQLYRHWWQEA